MALRIPGVEVTDDCDAARVRRPYGKAYAGNAIDHHELGAEDVSQGEMTSFIEEIDIDFAEERTKSIGIFRFLLGIGPRDPQLVGSSLFDMRLEQTVDRAARHRSQ